MPDPRLRTILEGQLTDVETNADAWNLPASEFSMPELQDQSSETPGSPSSPYECHSPSPLMHTVDEIDYIKGPASRSPKCGPECDVQGRKCKHYPPEHSLHHWRRWSIPSVKPETTVHLKEVSASPDTPAEHTLSTPPAISPIKVDPAPSTEPHPAPVATESDSDNEDATAYAARVHEAQRHTAVVRAATLSGLDDDEQVYANAWERHEKLLPLM